MTTTCNVSQFGLYHSYCKTSNLCISYRLIMGKVTCLTWPQKTCMKNPRYTRYEYSGLLTFDSFIFLKKIACHWQHCKVEAFCGLAETYLWRHRSVTWPDLTWKWKVHNVRLEWGVIHAKFQLSIGNGSGAIARKPSGGGGEAPHRQRIKIRAKIVWYISFVLMHNHNRLKTVSV